MLCFGLAWISSCSEGPYYEYLSPSLDCVSRRVQAMTIAQGKTNISKIHCSLKLLSVKALHVFHNNFHPFFFL